MDHLTEVLALIESQQKEVTQYSAPWMVGEQLKDMCREEPACAELLCQDLRVKEMHIREAEKKIKALADKRRVKNSSSSCVTPMEADKVLREFYGLPERGKKPEPPAAAPVSGGNVIDLSDFL